LHCFDLLAANWKSCSFICVLFGLRKYPGKIPLVGSCSAAIAAACHPIGDDLAPDTVEKPLKWGVVGERNGVKHLSFSKNEVDEPVEGVVYA